MIGILKNCGTLQIRQQTCHSPTRVQILLVGYYLLACVPEGKAIRKMPNLSFTFFALFMLLAKINIFLC